MNELLSWTRGFVLHVMTGLIAVMAHYSLMWLVLQTSAAPIVASSSGFLAGALVRFLLSYIHVFNPTIGVPTALVRFMVALMLQMITNALLLEFFINIEMGVWAAQVLSTVVLTASNFIIYRLWVFR